MKTTFSQLTAALLAVAFLATIVPETLAGPCGGGGGYRPRPYRKRHYHPPVYCPPPIRKVIVERPEIIHETAGGFGGGFAGAPEGPAPGGPRGEFAAGGAAGGFAAQLPLKLAEIRFVDPGDPALGLGPRYRIALEYRGRGPMQQALDLVLAAGTSRVFAPGLPQTIQRLSNVQSGKATVIDLRLPTEALAMNYAGEKEPAPFNTLFVMLAGQADLQGNAQLQKLAIVPRIGIESVQLTLNRPANSNAASGSVITLSGEGFDRDLGQVTLRLGTLQLRTEVLRWGALGIEVKLPELAISGPASGEIIIRRADGAVAQPLKLQITPAGQGKAQGQGGQLAPPEPRASVGLTDLAAPIQAAFRQLQAR